MYPTLIVNWYLPILPEKNNPAILLNRIWQQCSLKKIDTNEVVMVYEIFPGYSSWEENVSGKCFVIVCIFSAQGVAPLEGVALLKEVCHCGDGLGDLPPRFLCMRSLFQVSFG